MLKQTNSTLYGFLVPCLKGAWSKDTSAALSMEFWGKQGGRPREAEWLYPKALLLRVLSRPMFAGEEQGAFLVAPSRLYQFWNLRLKLSLMKAWVVVRHVYLIFSRIRLRHARMLSREKTSPLKTILLGRLPASTSFLKYSFISIQSISPLDRLITNITLPI